MQKLPSTVQTDSRKLVEDLYDFLGTIVRGWRLIVVCVGITLALAVIYLARVKPVYQASARLLVLQHGGQPLNVANGASNNPDNLFQSVDGSSNALLKSIEQGLKSVEGDAGGRVEQVVQHDLAESNKSEIGQLAESNLRNNLERQRALFYSVVDQLKQAQLVSDFGSLTAQVLDPPAATENRPSILLVLIAAPAQCDTVPSSSPLAAEGA